MVKVALRRRIYGSAQVRGKVGADAGESRKTGQGTRAALVGGGSAGSRRAFTRRA
jgi:hypothetical protein